MRTAPIKPHIQTKDDYLDRLDRETQHERECARAEAREAEDREHDASMARYHAFVARGGSEAEFEIREEALHAESQRLQAFVNGEISRIFAGAIATTEERRAA
jgi:hypothetical protein